MSRTGGAPRDQHHGHREPAAPRRCSSSTNAVAARKSPHEDTARAALARYTSSHRARAARPALLPLEPTPPALTAPALTAPPAPALTAPALAPRC